MARVLFILKFRDYDYGCSYGDGLSSGLFNSARLVVDMLNANGVAAKLVQVTDNNDIDREVHAYKPTHAIIEGLWVVPEKFKELIPLHPRVQWIVRIHSEIPFLAMEGVAMDWIARYDEFGGNVRVACNSERAQQAINGYIHEIDRKCLGASGISIGRRRYPNTLLLPNYYPYRRPWWKPYPNPELLRIGCFGAIRPMKNQLIQAMAAIEFAEARGKKLRFYMTHRDSEQGGDQVLKNIRALFAHTGHELVLRRWMPHEDFLGIMDMLDAGMQVSLSETFCIVAADMVSAGVPVVVSPEVRWASGGAKAEPTSLPAIVEKLKFVTSPIFREWVSFQNRAGLAEYSHRSKHIWLRALDPHRERFGKAA